MAIRNISETDLQEIWNKVPELTDEGLKGTGGIRLRPETTCSSLTNKHV